MTDSSDENERPAAREAKKLPPRFGIAHLLLWVAGCAVYLGFLRAMTDRPPGVLGLAIVAGQAIGYGAALAGLSIFVYRRLRRVPWPIEPGEWLLAALGARFAAELVLILWLVPRYVAWPGPILAVIVCCMLSVAILSRRLAMSWKLFFFVMLLLFARPAVQLSLAALDLSSGPTVALAIVYVWLETLVLCLLAGALAAVELIRGLRRGWLHWLGLGTLAWYAIMSAMN